MSRYDIFYCESSHHMHRRSRRELFKAPSPLAVHFGPRLGLPIKDAPNSIHFLLIPQLLTFPFPLRMP